MTKRCATYMLFAAITVVSAAPTLAQSVPEGQSCGGLLCDMGVFGHKTAPKADAAPTPAAPVASAPRAEAKPSVAAVEDPTPEPTRRVVKKKKRIAKIAPPVPPAPKDSVAIQAPVPVPSPVALQAPAVVQAPSTVRAPATAQAPASVQAPMTVQAPKSPATAAPAVAAVSKPADTGQAGGADAAATPPPPTFRFRTLY